MYVAYYDASGGEHDPGAPLVVAGLLSTESRWTDFEKEWAAVLRDFGVPYLRMSEFAHSLGAFSSWRNEREKRRAFLVGLLAPMQRAIQRAFIFHLIPAEFEAVDSMYDLALIGADGSRAGPYGMASLLCLHSATEFVWTADPGKLITHAFEFGDKGQALLAWLTGRRHNHPTVRLRIELARGAGAQEWRAQYQAADFFAYEWRKELLRQSLGGKGAPRLSYQALMAAVPTVASTITESGLLQMCRDDPAAWPPRPPA